jgi:hypothetical protein
MRWLQARVLGEGKISAGDLNLMLITDNPAEAASAVLKAFELQATAAETRKRHTPI